MSLKLAQGFQGLAIIALLLFFCTEANCQQQVALTGAPYPVSTKEARWLEKRGFNIVGYDWSHDEVNHYLLAALEQRRRAQKVWLIGGLAAGGSVVLGIVGVVGAFAAGGNRESVFDSIFIGMSVAGFVGVWGSIIVTPIIAIIKGNKARRFVRTAIEILLDSERKSP